MTGFYIAMIIIAIIGLIIILPITAVISFSVNSDENEITIRYLFFKLKILPAGEKKDKPKEDKEEEEKPKKDSKGIVSSVWISRSEIKWGVSKLLYYVIHNAIIVKELNISARFGFDNPMNTGLASGALNAVVYNIIGLLDRHARLKKWSVDLKPDFDETCIMAGVYCKLRTRIAHIFPLAAILLITFIKIKIKTKEGNNGGKKNEQSD